MNRYKSIAKTAVIIGIFGLVLYIAGPRRCWDCLKQANLPILFGASLMTAPMLLLKIAKWHMLARSLGPDITWSLSARSYMQGFILAVITPLTAGELARGAFLSKSKSAEATGLVVIDKIVDLSCVCILSTIGLAYLAHGVISLISLVLTILLLLFGFILFATSWPRRFLERFPRIPLAGTFSKMIMAVQKTRKRDIGTVFLFGIFHFFFLYSQCYILLFAFMREWPPLASIAAYPFITLSTIFPIAIGGIGVREGAAVALMRAFDIPEPIAFNAFFANWIVVIVIPAILLYPFVLRKTPLDRDTGAISAK